MVEEIRKRVDAAGVGRDKLVIEITESTVGRDFDYMKEQVRRFRELGFSVWMDDFGSGYSSLNNLKSYPFDMLKIDMNFLRDFACRAVMRKSAGFSSSLSRKSRNFLFSRLLRSSNFRLQ